jgi:hypothetical protein
MTRSANLIFDRVATAGIVDDVAKLELATTRGLITPGNQILPMFGLSLPNLEHTARRTIAGTGASAFDDAVKALRNLGRHHGVEGISLSHDPNALGLIMTKGGIGYEGGGNILRHLGDGNIETGRAVARRIDVAARRVLEFAG